MLNRLKLLRVLVQDYHYFPYEKDSMIAAFLHLDAAGPENGGLFVYPGSHALGPQEDVGAKETNYHYVDQVSVFRNLDNFRHIGSMGYIDFLKFLRE